MNAKHILIVEDEQPIREMVAFALTNAGYDAREAADARQAQVRIAERLPDLVLLDWMLPGISGIDYARRLKKDELTRDLPIIMLTARAEEEDTVQGLETGADDYMTKPFSPRELVARIRAVLRRGGPAGEEEMLRANGLSIDLASHRVSAGDTPLEMGPTEYRLLEFLMERPGRVFSREQLLNGVWGNDVFIDERTVDVHVGRLRKALNRGREPDPIRTVRGSGYSIDDRFGKTH